ncbi:hypothetical protein [Halopiger thermotolerans]
MPSDDSVYVATNAHNRDRRAYHTDPECSRMPESVREWDRDEAEEWGFEECDYCSGEIGLNNDGGDHSMYQRLVELGEKGGDGLDA